MPDNTRPGYVRWLLWALVVCLVCGFVGLARWQVGRAEEKQLLLDQQLQRMNKPAVPLTGDMANLAEQRYRPVILNGYAEGRHQFLLDNQIKPGQGAGYWVLLPVRLASGQTVLLNRGWVVAGGYRDQLPDVSMPSGEVRVEAYLDAFPEPGIKLDGAEVPEPGWPAVIQWVDGGQIKRRLGEDVLPFQAVLKADQPWGFEPIDPGLPMGPEKHYGYAFQWASLALALLLLSAWVEWKSKNRHP